FSEYAIVYQFCGYKSKLVELN
ncbi:MAG: hypothetical protein RIR90_98, partial [Bacteroidota bacterium]